jgi:hypothetical protein
MRWARITALLNLATRTPLRCCVCIGLMGEELPEGDQTRELTIINGHLVCTAHGAYAGPNIPLEGWHNAANLRAQRTEERAQRRREEQP